MTATMLAPIPTLPVCSLPWCMRASGCTVREVGDGSLHYGRPSSVGSYEGNPVTATPFQHDDSDGSGTTGPRVEVGADNNGRIVVPLRPAAAVDFARALRTAAAGRADVLVMIESDPEEGELSGWVTVSPNLKTVTHGGFDYDLVEMTFCVPHERDDEPMTVQMRDWEAAQYANWVEMATREVTA